jgi:hypothetical protein
VRSLRLQRIALRLQLLIPHSALQQKHNFQSGSVYHQGMDRMWFGMT